MMQPHGGVGDHGMSGGQVPYGKSITLVLILLTLV